MVVRLSFNLILKILWLNLTNPKRVKNPRETSICLWESLNKIRPSLLPACVRLISTRVIQQNTSQSFTCMCETHFDKSFVQKLIEILVSPLDYSPDSDSIRFLFRFGLSVRSLYCQVYVFETNTSGKNLSIHVYLFLLVAFINYISETILPSNYLLTCLWTVLSWFV